MSLIPEDFRKKVKEDLDKIELFKRVLEKDEIEKKMKAFIEFYKEKIDTDEFFYDGSADWVMIQSPEPNEDESNKPRSMPSEYNDDNFLWICKCKAGQISVFGTHDHMNEINWGNNVIIRGKLKKQYKSTSSKEYYKTLNDICEELGKDFSELTENDYFTSYSINVYQVIQ